MSCTSIFSLFPFSRKKRLLTIAFGDLADDQLKEMVQTNPALLGQLPPDYQVRLPSSSLLSLFCSFD